MPRMSYEEAVAQAQTAVQSAGGEMTGEAFTSAVPYEVMTHFRAMKSNGVLNVRVDSRGEGEKPQLRISLPGGSV